MCLLAGKLCIEADYPLIGRLSNGDVRVQYNIRDQFLDIYQRSLETYAQIIAEIQAELSISPAPGVPFLTRHASYHMTGTDDRGEHPERLMT